MARKTEVMVVVVQTTEGGKVGVIHVWADNVSKIQVEEVEGVTVMLASIHLPVFIHVDARYDAHEVAAEIEELLSSEVTASLYNAARAARDGEEK